MPTGVRDTVRSGPLLCLPSNFISPFFTELTGIVFFLSFYSTTVAVNTELGEDGNSGAFKVG